MRPKVHPSLNRCDFVVGLKSYTMIPVARGLLYSTCGKVRVIWPLGQTQPDSVQLNGSERADWSVVTRGRRTKQKFAST